MAVPPDRLPGTEGPRAQFGDGSGAIRLDPCNPALFLERFEEAVADHDRAIGLDPDSAAAAAAG